MEIIWEHVYIPSMPCYTMPCHTPSKLQPEEAAQTHSLSKVMALRTLQAAVLPTLVRNRGPYQHLVPRRDSRLRWTIMGLMGVGESCLSHDTSPEYSEILFLEVISPTFPPPSLPPSFSSSMCSPAPVYCLSGNCPQVLM